MRAKPIHTISLLASALALALPTSSFALGLGRLTVDSALGQPLSARIELNSASREDLDSIAARIADPALYRQNNLAYPPILTRARVSLERSPSGQTVLRVSTTAPVNEPYLDLLVEINWAAGRVVREYTFLLDPPGMPTPAPVIEPIAPVRAGAATQRAAIATAPAAPGSAPRAVGGAAGDRYSVRRGDSLARIANQFRPEGVSLEQMLVALFNANPMAFEGNNMNRLRAGTILSIPAPEVAGGIPAADALHVVQVQAADWRGYRGRVADAAPASEGTGTRESAGQIGTTVQERTPAVQPGQDQVRVSREAVRGRPGAPAAEDAVARDRAMADAQARIAELEKTLSDLKRALEMRNPAMAQLQNRAEAGKGAAANAGTTASAGAAAVAPSLPVGAPASAAATKSTQAGTSAPEPAKAPELAMKSPENGKAGEAPKSPGATAPAPGTPAMTMSPAPTPAPSAAAGERPAKSTKSEPSTILSYFEDLIGDPPAWMLGAGGVLILGAIAALIASRRRKAGHFEDSIISGTDIKSNTVFGSTGGGIVNTGENSLATDFSHEGLTNVDTDEVDPIAEAEVYLAYGRDAQAEEILKDALKKDPQRQEIYLKLLEIHAQHNKPTVFEQVATELYAVSKGQGETWQKAVALGRQLDPNNPMFAAEGAGGAPSGLVAAAGAATAAAAGAAAMRYMDNDDPLRRAPDTVSGAAVESTPPVPVGVADIRNDEGLDFRLGDDISIAAPPVRKTSEQIEAVASTTLADAEPAIHDLEFTAHAAPAHAAAAEPAPAMTIEQRIEAARAADPGFDLDFHIEEAEKPAASRAAEVAGDDAAKPAQAHRSWPAPRRRSISTSSISRSIPIAQRSTTRPLRCWMASGTTRRPSSTSPRRTRRWATWRVRARSCRRCCTRATSSSGPRPARCSRSSAERAILLHRGRRSDPPPVSFASHA